MCFLFFSALFGSPLNLWAALCLSLVVWGIYTLDHIIDGYKRKEYSPSLRHYLHYVYRKVLIPIVSLSFVAALFIAFIYLDVEIRRFGFGVSIAIVAAYLVNFWGSLILKKKMPWKELGIAIIVSLCFVYLPTINSAIHNDNLRLWLLIVFSGINAANLYIFSLYDYELDVRSGFASIAAYVSKKYLRVLVGFLLGSSLLGLTYMVGSDALALIPALVLGLMWIQLVIVFWFKRYFAESERYRFWGDLIYIYPVLFFLL